MKTRSLAQLNDTLGALDPAVAVESQGLSAAVVAHLDGAQEERWLPAGPVVPHLPRAQAGAIRQLHDVGNGDGRAHPQPAQLAKVGP